MVKSPAAVFCLIAMTMAGAASASGLPMATEWDWARDGGRIVNALVVLGAIGYAVSRFAIPIVRKRAADIRNEIEELILAREMAEKSLADYQKKLDEIKVEHTRAMAEARAEAEVVRKRILDQAGEAAAGAVKRAGEQIEMETERARARLRAETTLLAIAAAEEILRKTIGPEDQKTLLANYIEKMGRRN